MNDTFVPIRFAVSVAAVMLPPRDTEVPAILIELLARYVFAIFVPFHVPLVIVPRVVMLVDPVQSLTADTALALVKYKLVPSLM